MRARDPDQAGYVVRHSVRIYYEVFGDGRPTVWLMPTWPIVHSRFLARGLRCPVLIIHGDKDMCQPSARAKRLAALTGGRLVNLKGAGHMPHVRHPVILNLLIKDFVDSLDRAFDPTGKGTGHARARG